MTPYYYDLHIHSCLSPCADDDMTPNNIAGMATLKGLNLLALTDHNSCKNCPAFFEACHSRGIVPIAGMELSTAEDIHLICLFEQLENAMAFDVEISKHLQPIRNRSDIFGKQQIYDETDQIVGEEELLLISATDLWLGEAIRLAKQFGAHIHPAHIDREANGIVSILGTIPEEYRFSCFEFRDKENFAPYQKKWGCITPETALFCSDAHHLWDINEAEHRLLLNDTPYCSSLIRQHLFEHFAALDGNGS